MSERIEPHPPGSPPARCVLAFDFGLRRIGVAAGDTLTGTARPLATVRCGDQGPDWEQLKSHVRTLGPAILVVGLPTQADGTPSTLHKAARRFAGELAGRFELPVDFVDEHGSSLEAAGRLRQQRQSGRRRRVSREDIDSAAAALILSRWLAGERAPNPLSGPPPP